jgi:hypothetical protein
MSFEKLDVGERLVLFPVSLHLCVIMLEIIISGQENILY